MNVTAYLASENFPQLHQTLAEFNFWRSFEDGSRNAYGIRGEVYAHGGMREESDRQQIQQAQSSSEWVQLVDKGEADILLV